MDKVKELRFDFSFSIPSDVLEELEIAAGDISSPVNLMISHILSGHGGFSMIAFKPKAEAFLETILSTVHQIPMRYIAKCRVDYLTSVLHLTIVVDKSVLVEWLKA